MEFIYEAGMLTEEQSPDGLIKYLEYDERNLPVHVWDNAGREIHNRYDEAGNLLENRIRQNEKVEQVTTFTYDRRGRILPVTDAEGNTESYRYDTSFCEPSLYTMAAGRVRIRIFYSYVHRTSVTEIYTQPLQGE